MIRPFDWRDFGLLRRLADRGLCLDTETGLTRGPQTLQKALFSYLTPVASMPTFVLTPGDGAGSTGAFGQVRHRPGSEYARVMCLAPAEIVTAPAGYELLEQLSIASGQRGAHNLLAEVADGSPEFITLRALGFAVYARQDIWQLPAEARDLGAAPELRLRESADTFGITTLYLNNVPSLVQQVEPPPGRRSRGYVHVSEDEILAYRDIARGPLGILVQPYFHPAVQDVARMLSQFVRQLPNRRNRRVYFNVRSYQTWLSRPLQEVGFELFAEQAVLVKRLAVRSAHLELAPVRVLEGGAGVASTMLKSELIHPPGWPASCPDAPVANSNAQL